MTLYGSDHRPSVDSETERHLAKLRADAATAQAHGGYRVPTARPLPNPASVDASAYSPVSASASASAHDPRLDSTTGLAPLHLHSSLGDGLHVLRTSRVQVESQDGGVRLAGGPLFEDGDTGPEVELLPPSYAQLHPSSR